MIVQNTSSQTVQAAPSSAVASPPAVTPKAPDNAANVPKSDSPPTAAVSNGALSVAVDAVNSALQRSGNSLRFTIDRETESAVVTMVDSETGEVIRQIPSDEALAIARSIDAMLQQRESSCGPGLLCKQVA